MTLPPDLPEVYYGMMWDGVTEYKDDIDHLVEDKVRIVSTDPNGSRQIDRKYIDHSSTIPMTDLIRARDQGYINLCIVRYSDHSYRRNVFVNYGDGELTYDPVNQVPYLEGWLDPRVDGEKNIGWYVHTCTFANEVTQLPSHTVQHLARSSHSIQPDSPHNDDSNDRMRLGYLYGRILTGFVFETLERWAARHHTDPLWRTHLPTMQALIESICIACPNPYWLRELVVNMSVPEWEEVLSSRVDDDLGTNYVVVPKFDRNTWLPTDRYFAASHTSGSARKFFGDWIESHKSAVARFDKLYARREHV